MLTYASLTETGKRKHNEDSSGITQKEAASFFVLADGLGLTTAEEDA